jgi:hypothetical protein
VAPSLEVEISPVGVRDQVRSSVPAMESAMRGVQARCQFVNFWKDDSDNKEFCWRLMLARGAEAA